MSNPNLEHLEYLDYIFSYLVKTKDLGLDLTLEQPTKNSTSNSIRLVGISDADWGGDLESRKSTLGNIFLLENISKKSIAIS
jgi:hypothetical protein